MKSKEHVCRKIEELLPEAGKCGRDFSVTYDQQNHAWSVDLHQGKIHLKTFIEDDEAEGCLDEQKCIPLALQIGQLRRNLNLYGQS